jgi:hypothetical protein
MTYGTTPYGTEGGVPSDCLDIAYLIERTFDLLLQAAREERNRLTNPLNLTDTEFAVDFPAGNLQAGTFIAIDNEVMYVWATTTAGNGATVQVVRGDKGSSPATHDAQSIVAVNPFFTQFSVRKTLQDEIRSWGPQVFQVKETDIALADFIRGYDLGILGPFFYLLNVMESPDQMTGLISDNLWRRIDYSVDRSADVNTFPSGAAIYITDPLGVFDTPRSLHITYAAPIDVDTAFSDSTCITATGMDYSDIDIAPYGAAWRLASGREVRRMLVEGQGQNSDLSNFPPGYMIKAGADFKEFRDARLKDAVERLRSQYPIRR